MVDKAFSKAINDLVVGLEELMLITHRQTISEVCKMHMHSGGATCLMQMLQLVWCMHGKGESLPSMTTFSTTAKERQRGRRRVVGGNTVDRKHS